MGASLTIPSARVGGFQPAGYRALRSFALLVIALPLPLQGEVAWQSVRGAQVRSLFGDHELADGVHFAYQFHPDGSFTGVSMGKAVRGTWDVAGDEFCWTQARRKAEEECFEVERNGQSVRLLRDGVVVFSCCLSRFSAVRTLLHPDEPHLTLSET